VDLIDNRLTPLFLIENGTYTFKPDKIHELASVADDAKALVASIEKTLIKRV